MAGTISDGVAVLALALIVLLAACSRGPTTFTPTAAPSSPATASVAPGTSAEPTLPMAVVLSASPEATPIRPAVATPTAVAAVACAPTRGDELSPTYRPGAPVRATVGHGHILSGIVRSSRDCAPIAGAQVELWPEAPGGSHPEAERATLYADSAGAYQFECDPPDHIHMRVSAPGHRSFASNAYHPGGRALGTFDIVLAPDAP